MERDESGKVVIRRAADEKLYGDLVRFNSITDEVTIDIVIISTYDIVALC
jgi:hypothetical protein